MEFQQNGGESVIANALRAGIRAPSALRAEMGGWPLQYMYFSIEHPATAVTHRHARATVSVASCGGMFGDGKRLRARARVRK